MVGYLTGSKHAGPPPNVSPSPLHYCSLSSPCWRQMMNPKVVPVTVVRGGTDRPCCPADQGLSVINKKCSICHIPVSQCTADLTSELPVTCLPSPTEDLACQLYVCSPCIDRTTSAITHLHSLKLVWCIMYQLRHPKTCLGIWSCSAFAPKLNTYDLALLCFLFFFFTSTLLSPLLTHLRPYPPL